MEKENSSGKRVITDEERQAGRLLREQRKKENKNNLPIRLSKQKQELERQLTSAQNKEYWRYKPLNYFSDTINVDTGSYKDIGELYLKAAELQKDSNYFDVVIIHNFYDQYDCLVYPDMSIDGVRLYYKRKPTQIEIDKHIADYNNNKNEFDMAKLELINHIQSQISKIDLQLRELK